MQLFTHPVNTAVSILVPSSKPLVTPGAIVIAISAGYYHTCAVATGGNVYCWGWNSNGELGIGSTASKDSPVAVSGE